MYAHFNAHLTLFSAFYMYIHTTYYTILHIQVIAETLKDSPTLPAYAVTVGKKVYMHLFVLRICNIN